MGADMCLLTIWTIEGKIEIDKAIAVLAAAIHAETDPDVLAAAADYVDCGICEPLAEAVVSVEPESQKAWREQIIAGYRTRLQNFANDLDSRDVTRITLGPLVGYATGGMTWGDDPTDTFSDWWGLFFQQDGAEWDANPYAEALHQALFVQFPGDASPLPGVPTTHAHIAFRETPAAA